MKRTKHLGALAAALLAIGCATAPMSGQVGAGPKAPRANDHVDVLRSLDPNGYRVLAFGDWHPALTSVEPSSTRPGYPVENATDGVLTTAWGPADCNETVSLTYRYAELVRVGQVGLKVSLGRFSSPTNSRVFVDVWTSDDGGTTWHQAANDLNPDETVLQLFNFAPATANAVRLEFSAPEQNLCDLLVCYANLCDTSTYVPPSAAPTSWPSAGPSTWVPSVAPSGEPSAWPPSAAPSWAPSDPPSAAPSNGPSDAPSDGPSGGPSTAPSSGPSTTPSVAPSAAPSVAPSTAPSVAPSGRPGGPPSDKPGGGPPSDPPGGGAGGVSSPAPSPTPTLASPSTAPSAAASTTPTSTPTTTPSAGGVGTGASDCGTYMSYTPGAWGAPPTGGNAGSILHDHWSSIAPAGTVTVGIGNAITFTSAQALTDFLPCNGGSQVLGASQTNPTSQSVSSTLVSHTTALKLEVLAGGLLGTQDLRPVIYTGGGPLDGWSIQAILMLAEQYIGGTITTLPGGMAATDLIGVVASINLFFEPTGTPDGVTFTCPSEAQ